MPRLPPRSADLRPMPKLRDDKRSVDEISRFLTEPPCGDWFTRTLEEGRRRPAARDG